jgi:TetR/AcrR family transcriptional regulator, cholesterol catabolism regulator
MPRIAEGRVPATPVTKTQESRQSAILRAAARLGADRDIERISAQEIAAASGVALRTLYRYYPSKYHVFAAVLSEQVRHVDTPHPASGDPASDVEDMIANACTVMLARPQLAHAMITSTQAVRARPGASPAHSLRDLILRTAGVHAPTAEQIRVARLVEQVTFGILTWTVGGELDAAQAVADVRLACRLLLTGLV